MPANLTPEFIKARNRFREAKEPAGKLAALEEMLSTIPKHKGTDKMQADIKRRIARLKESESQAKRGGKAIGYDHVPREGAGQVALIGPPNTGKSSLVAALTNARPEVAEYPFSTLVPIPGMMTYKDIRIQLVDLPPITPEYTEAWVYSVIRACDMGLVVLDAGDGELLVEESQGLLRLLEERSVRLVVQRRARADERIVDLPARIVLNKSETAPGEALGAVVSRLPLPSVGVSATSGRGLESLRQAVFEALEIVRVYTKMPGKKPDLREPYTLPRGSTVLDGVRTVHREFAERLKYVRIWGSGRFDGQQVPSDHVLEDGDVMEVHLK